MRRVMIVGGPGSGKTTMAHLIGDRTGLPVYHLDQIHWQDNWVERPLEEKRALAQAVEDRESWVFEGGMSAAYDNRIARADTLIWLDLPFRIRLWLAAKRSVRRWGKSVPDLPRGCVERLDFRTLLFFLFICATWRSAHTKVAALVDTAPEKVEVVHLTSPQQVCEWLEATA